MATIAETGVTTEPKSKSYWQRAKDKLKERKELQAQRKKEREKKKAEEKEKREKEECAAYEKTMKEEIGYLLGSPDNDGQGKTFLKQINICYGHAENKEEFLTKTGKMLMEKLAGKARESSMYGTGRTDSERTTKKIMAKDNLISIMRSDPPEYGWYADLLEKWPDKHQGGKKRKSRRKSRRKRRKSRRKSRRKNKSRKRRRRTRRRRR